MIDEKGEGEGRNEETKNPKPTLRAITPRVFDGSIAQRIPLTGSRRSDDTQLSVRYYHSATDEKWFERRRLLSRRLLRWTSVWDPRGLNEVRTMKCIWCASATRVRTVTVSRSGSKSARCVLTTTTSLPARYIPPLSYAITAIIIPPETRVYRDYLVLGPARCVVTPKFLGRWSEASGRNAPCPLGPSKHLPKS